MGGLTLRYIACLMPSPSRPVGRVGDVRVENFRNVEATIGLIAMISYAIFERDIAN